VAVVYLYGTQEVVGVTKEEFLNSSVYLSAFVETVATLVNSSSVDVSVNVTTIYRVMAKSFVLRK
jgi:putative N-acetylmannosamine-6-phosphate epimerase